MAIKKVTLPLLGSELKNKLNEIIGQFVSNIIEYGADGRLRFDESTKHFYFEVKQTDGSWLTKFEVGGSAYVDIMYFLATQAPANLRPGSVAQYTKEITLKDGTNIERPHFKTDDGEFSFVVSDISNDSVLFRKNNGDVIHIPVIYEDENGVNFTNFNKIKFTGGATLSNNADGDLEINIISSGTSNVIDDSASSKTTTYSSDKILDVIPNGAEVVKLIDDDLGSTDWQSGGGSSTNIIDDTEPKYDKTYSSKKVESVISFVAEAYSRNEVIERGYDFNIDSNNYLDYAGATIVATKTKAGVQRIEMPRISTLTKSCIFRISNRRENAEKVLISIPTPDTINKVAYIRLDLYDTITIEKPKTGKDWIILSKFKENYGGAVTPADVINGGNSLSTYKQ